MAFVTAAALVNELMEARDEKRLLRRQRQLAKVKLLIIDELGFVPLSKTGAELLFELISQRYEQGSTLITSNLPFEEWDGYLRHGTSHWRSAGPTDPPRQHSGNERRKLSFETRAGRDWRKLTNNNQTYWPKGQCALERAGYMEAARSRAHAKQTSHRHSNGRQARHINSGRLLRRHLAGFYTAVDSRAPNVDFRNHRRLC